MLAHFCAVNTHIPHSEKHVQVHKNTHITHSLKHVQIHQNTHEKIQTC